MLLRCALLALCAAISIGHPLHAQSYVLKSNIPYADSPQERQVLDIYAPKDAKNLPVMFWIHGGGWQAGDKTEVNLKPQVFVDRSMIFVSTNYRLLPKVEMETIVADVAKSLAWVHKHIAEYGGDPKRIVVGGHSAGAQLAALVCIDNRLLKAEGVDFSSLKGCIPVDGDTYDIPAIIETAETRRRAHGEPQAKMGHREKFGHTAEKHKDFSAVTHIAKEKGIPPFLILYVADHPDTSAQARRLSTVLTGSNIKGQLVGARDTNHSKLNDNLGKADDPTTQVVYKFLDEILK